MNKQLSIHHLRRWLRLATTLVLAGSLLAQAILGWPAGAPHNSYAQRSALAVVQQATLTLQPASGPVGTTVSVSATSFPREADLSNGATLSFDTTPIAGEQAPIVGCTGIAFTFGFGPACNANSAPLTYTIPQNTAPGSHIFVATVVSSASTFTSNPAPFMVIAPASPSGTATVVPQPTATVNTPTVTATATATTIITATAVEGTNTATATSTATQPPMVPTATFTPVPSSPTPSATKMVYPQAIVLIKPAFSASAVAIVVHTNANAHVTIEFQVLALDAQGHQHQQYDLKKGGTAGSLGVFTIRMVIAYHKPGTAVITVTLSGGGSTRTVRRSYRYGVTGR